MRFGWIVILYLVGCANEGNLILFQGKTCKSEDKNYDNDSGCTLKEYSHFRHVNNNLPVCREVFVVLVIVDLKVYWFLSSTWTV